ncbi:unnamed protein product [Alternaria alternata]
MFDILRNRPRHERLLQRDSESHDDDTLLPGSSSSTSLTLKSQANERLSRDVQVANLLRKTLHWNFDYYKSQKKGPFINSEYIVRLHTTHCLDILRQVLQCNPE